jgi:hypothetical protein
MEFEPTVPASKRAKIVYALDRSATVTGPCAGLRNWKSDEDKNQQLWSHGGGGGGGGKAEMVVELR